MKFRDRFTKFHYILYHTFTTAVNKSVHKVVFVIWNVDVIRDNRLTKDELHTTNVNFKIPYQLVDVAISVSKITHAMRASLNADNDQTKHAVLTLSRKKDNHTLKNIQTDNISSRLAQRPRLNCCMDGLAAVHGTCHAKQSS